MAEHWYPCPSCGQQQRVTKAAGEVVTPENCAACAEVAAEAQELEELVDRERAPRARSAAKGK